MLKTLNFFILISLFFTFHPSFSSGQSPIKNQKMHENKKASPNLYLPDDTLEQKREKIKKLMEEVVADYKKNPDKTVRDINNPEGPYTNIDKGGDAHVAYVDKHGRYWSPKYKNSQNTPLSGFMSPRLDNQNDASVFQTGKKLLELMSKMKPGQEIFYLFPSNKRPSTGRPAEAVALLHKTERGGLIVVPYYTIDLLHLEPHPSSHQMGK